MVDGEAGVQRGGEVRSAPWCRSSTGASLLPPPPSAGPGAVVAPGGPDLEAGMGWGRD